MLLSTEATPMGNRRWVHYTYRGPARPGPADDFHAFIRRRAAVGTAWFLRQRHLSRERYLRLRDVPLRLGRSRRGNLPHLRPLRPAGPASPAPPAARPPTPATTRPRRLPDGVGFFSALTPRAGSRPPHPSPGSGRVRDPPGPPDRGSGGSQEDPPLED